MTGKADFYLIADITANFKINASKIISVFTVNADGSFFTRATDNAFALLSLRGNVIANLIITAPEIDSDILINSNGIHTIMLPDNASANLNLSGRIIAHIYIKAANVNGFISLMAKGKSTVRIRIPKTYGSIDLQLKGIGTRRIWQTEQDAYFYLDSYGVFRQRDILYISLPGLVLRPSSELIIDTDQMTVMLDGVNVTRYFSPDSEFFKLRPGNNLLIYEDGVQNRDVQYIILWKDLWL